MLKQIKKGLSMLLLSAKALVLILILIYIGLLSDDLRIMSTMGATDVSYVLVNEDLGTVFNGVEHNLGAEFITLITQDTQNRWQTASRSVAEAGFRSGAFDVMIILPQDFSTRLLALQSFTPEQAEIIYEVRHGQNELVNMSINAQVTDVLNEFNERIVRMYFASMLNSLFDAQLEFGVLVEGESDRHDFFISHVQNLFLRLPNEFLSVVMQSETLQGRTEGWRLGHEHFVETTQGALLTTVETMSANTDALANYIALMLQMSEVNLRNTRFAMNRQHDADEYYYRGQFSALYDDVSRRMEGFYDNEMNNFSGRGEEFRVNQDRLQESLDAQIVALSEQEEGLETLRSFVADTFFDGSTPPMGADDESIREAIISLIYEHRNPDECLAQIYIDTIEEYFGQLNIEEIEPMIDELHGMGFISDSQYDEYGYQLDVIRRFAHENGLDFYDGDVGFSWEHEDDAIQSVARFQRPKIFYIDPTVPWTIIELERVPLPSHVRHIHIYNSADIHNLESYINAQLVIQPLNAVFTPLTNEYDHIIGFRIDFSREQCDDGSGELEDCPLIGWPNPIRIEQLIELEWQFSPEERGSKFYQHNFDWIVRNEVTQVTMPFTISHLFPSHALGQNLSLFLEQVHLMERSTRQIITLFGDPYTSDDPDDSDDPDYPDDSDDSDYPDDSDDSSVAVQMSTAEFWDSLPPFDPNETDVCPSEETCCLTPSGGTTIRGAASLDSIYRRYGEISIEAGEEFIVRYLRRAFYGAGVELHGKTVGVQSCLDYIVYGGSDGETREENMRYCFHENTLNPDETFLSLSRIHEGMLPARTLLDEARALLDWHSNSLTGISGQYHTWSHGSIIELLSRENIGSPFSETYIYYNTQTGENMIQLTNLLVASSQNEISNIISGTANLETLDDEFNTMTTNTGNVSGQMDTLLGNIDVLDGELYTNVNANLAYAQNFGTIMENARIGGGYNPTFLNFLPRPLASVGAQAVAGDASIIPYYLTIISTILNFSAGYGLKYFWKKRERTAVDQLVNRGLIWKNTPFVLKLIAISLSLGLAFGAVSVRAIGQVQATSWMLFVPLLITFGILIVTYLARQFPKASLFIVGAVIAIYLLLNPVLGTQIEAGTFMASLFRASPLQHVENIFAMLYRGGFFSMINYVIMIGLVGLGILLNLLVTEKNIEVAGDAKDEK